jgi:uncharacterized membrane protein YhaH (DUF805 family)
MSDFGYFACLVISILSAVVAVVAAHSIVRRSGACGWSVALAISCSVGFVLTLPFRSTQELPWLPAVVGAFFAAVVLSTVLCCLCKITERGEKRSCGESH